MSTSTSPLIDSELQNQIDLLFEKSLSDLKIRTVKLVAKHYNKVLKDKSKNVKNSQSQLHEHHRILKMKMNIQLTIQTAKLKKVNFTILYHFSA